MFLMVRAIRQNRLCVRCLIPTIFVAYKVVVVVVVVELTLTNIHIESVYMRWI